MCGQVFHYLIRQPLLRLARIVPEGRRPEHVLFAVTETRERFLKGQELCGFRCGVGLGLRVQTQDDGVNKLDLRLATKGIADHVFEDRSQPRANSAALRVRVKGIVRPESAGPMEGADERVLDRVGHAEVTQNIVVGTVADAKEVTFVASVEFRPRTLGRCTTPVVPRHLAEQCHVPAVILFCFHPKLDA